MGVNKQFKRTLISAAITLGFAAGTVSAEDWTMVQGTEPKNAAMPAQPFGFVEVRYEKDTSTSNAGAFVPPKLIGPNLNSQSGFNVFHAQVGVKGVAFPLDDRINYMLLMEGGNNGNTNTAKGKGGIVITDASITASHVKGARVRMGLFKPPYGEEAMASTTATNYMNFSETTNQLVLERFPNTGGYTASVASGVGTLANLQNGTVNMNLYDKPSSGFRDTGVQVFDNFELKNDWDVTYAVMVGQGSGIEQNNVDGRYDQYFYFGAHKGEDKQGGLRFYVWNQTGKRLLDITNDSAANPLLYDRKRTGYGAHYEAKPYRVSFEYVSADGMIFEGPDKPNLYFAVPSNATNPGGYLGQMQYNGATQKANGFYMEGGYFIPKTNWELDLRYDTVAMNTGIVDEHKFTTITYGVQYNFNPKSRVMFNYATRDFKCTGSGAGCIGNATANLSGVGSKYGVQLTTAM